MLVVLLEGFSQDGSKQADSKKITEPCDSIPLLVRQAERINLLPFFKVVLFDAEIINKSIYGLGNFITVSCLNIRNVFIFSIGVIKLSLATC